MKYFTKSSMYNVHMKIQMHFEPIVVRGKYNQIAAFWNPIVCMIYMAAVLIQLLTLKHLLHFLQAIINYAEKLCFCSSIYLYSKNDKNVGKSQNECWIMI